MKTLTFIIALLPSMALANPGEELATVPLPNLTRETIVGTWEAVIPTEITGTTRGLWRMEIAKGPDFYLVGVEFDVEKTSVQLLAHGSELEVKSGDVTLRFKTVPADGDSKAEEIVFKGSGVCQGEIGALHGTLMIGGKPLGDSPATFGSIKAHGRELFRKHRRKQKSVFNSSATPQRPNQAIQRTPTRSSLHIF